MSASPSSTRSGAISTKPTSPEIEDTKSSDTSVAKDDEDEEMYQGDKPAVSHDDEDYKDDSDVEVMNDNTSRGATVRVFSPRS